MSVAAKIRIAHLQRIREPTFGIFTQNLATTVIEKTTLGVASEIVGSVSETRQKLYRISRSMVFVFVEKAT